MGNIGWAQLLIVLVIILLLFGTKKLRNLGGDLGSAVKGFKKAVTDKDADFDQESKKVEDKADEDLQHTGETNKSSQKVE